MAPGAIEPIRKISWLGNGTFWRNSWLVLVRMRSPSISGTTWLTESSTKVKLSLVGDTTYTMDPQLMTTAPEPHQTICRTGVMIWVSCSQYFRRKSKEPIHTCPIWITNLNLNSSGGLRMDYQHQLKVLYASCKGKQPKPRWRGNDGKIPCYAGSHGVHSDREDKCLSLLPRSPWFCDLHWKQTNNLEQYWFLE